VLHRILVPFDDADHSQRAPGKAIRTATVAAALRRLLFVVKDVQFRDFRLSPHTFLSACAFGYSRVIVNVAVLTEGRDPASATGHAGDDSQSAAVCEPGLSRPRASPRRRPAQSDSAPSSGNSPTQGSPLSATNDPPDRMLDAPPLLIARSAIRCATASRSAAGVTTFSQADPSARHCPASYLPAAASAWHSCL